MRRFVVPAAFVLLSAISCQDQFEDCSKTLSCPPDGDGDGDTGARACTKDEETSCGTHADASCAFRCCSAAC